MAYLSLYLLRLAAWDEGDIQWVCCIKSNPLLEDLVLGLSIGGEFMDRVLNNDPMSLLVLICLIWWSWVHPCCCKWCRFILPYDWVNESLPRLGSCKWCHSERWGACITFKLEFSPDICPGMGLPDLMVTQFLVFKGTSKLFSEVTAPIYIPTNS